MNLVEDEGAGVSQPNEGGLRIEHTDDAGTTIDGTARGDGSSEVLKRAGWRWGRSLGLWYVPRSRNVPPKRHVISCTAEALTAAGFTVAVSIDSTPADRDAVEARRVFDSAARAERLTVRATRHEQVAADRYGAARTIADGIPLGQPILVGHHSEARARRDAARLHAHMDAYVEHTATAEQARQAAQIAAAATGARNNPVTVANRVQRLAAEVRGYARQLDELERRWGPLESNRRDTNSQQGQERPGSDEDARQSPSPARNAAKFAVPVRERLEAAEADLAWWQRVREQQVADGRATDFGRHNIAAGDRVQVREIWYEVLRCNVKTVSVRGEFGARTTPWHEVQAHDPQGGHFPQRFPGTQERSTHG